MKENKLIEKLDHPHSKAKVLYKLTQKEIDLVPVMIEISLWTEKYYSVPEVRKAMLREVKKIRPDLLKQQ